MKLNTRFILLSFLVVLLISGSSTYIFYSLAGKVLTQQQKKTILNSTNDLGIALRSESQKMESDFQLLIPKTSRISSINLDSTSIDFLFTLQNDSLINTREFRLRSKTYLNIRSSSFRQFFNDNPGVFLNFARLANGRIIYYGRSLSAEMLNRIAQKIRSEVALVINNSPVEVSNNEKNQVHLKSVLNAVQDLKFKNSYDLYIASLEGADFIAALFTPKFLLTPPGVKVNFIVFQAFREGVEFRNMLRVVMVLIILAGSAVTFIVVFLFTAKLRKQIVYLSEGAELTSRGDLDHRVPIITKDEIGQFGETFNKMLDEIIRNKRAEREYSEFIMLINQNPTLSEISNAALSKIIKTTGLTFGVLYTVENKSLRLVSSYGISRNLVTPMQNSDLYGSAIEKKEKIEFHFNDNYPEIKTGIATIKIKYLMIFPVIYNSETIAVLELASESVPQSDVMKYIDNIHEQLAIGLTNAKSFEQLENLVYELEKLNTEYQKQNKQMVIQNQELKELHYQLREKAAELESQRAKAVELTKVKSEFLASMSHELRTPLISILGLTELILKDAETALRSKERLNIVYRNGKKLLGLINNILEFSKFESGKIEVKKESFLLDDLLEDINPNIKQIASEKNLKYSVEVEPDEKILINTDRMKLEQVLLNLLVNAVKFTNEGIVRLIVRISNSSDLFFEVIDTGIGISGENQKIIFSEFRQADTGAARRYSGAGLGLAICKRYVELLGGYLSLISEEGVGSKFSFVLPESVLDLIEDSGHKFLTISETDPGDGSPGSILIIDNNPESLKLLNDYFSSYGYKLLAASTKEEYLRIIKEQNPKAIIVNLPSGGLDVWNLIYRIKSDSSTNRIPVVLIIIDEDEKVGWTPRIFDFITEPVTFESLWLVIVSAGKYAGKNIERIAVVDSHKSEYDLLRNDEENGCDIKFFNNPGMLTSEIVEYDPDLVIIDLDFAPAVSPRVIYELSLTDGTKSLPVICKISGEGLSKAAKTFDSAMKEICLEVKAHPLDLLKQIRENLGIYGLDGKTPVTVNPDRSAVQNGRGKDEKATIMIVDDDNDALFTVGEFIKEMNFDVIFAHNGMECLITLNHVVPDLIFLDIMMPQMDGFETVKRIKSEKRLERIPVIALTAYAMLDNIEVIEKNGFDDLVTKPINSEVLAAKMKKFLKKGAG